MVCGLQISRRIPGPSRREGRGSQRSGSPRAVGAWGSPMKSSDVFVITEDDILKPTGSRKGKGAASSAAVHDTGGHEGSGGGAHKLTVAAPRTVSGAGHRSSPAIASTLSLWVWGLGQFYNGERKLATLFFLCQLQAVAFHYMLYAVWDRLRSFTEVFFVSEWEILLYVGAIDVCLLFLMLFNVAQAYRTAETGGGGRSFPGLHQPIVSGLASMIVPGWGQLLNGQLWKGLLFLSAFAIQGFLLGIYMLSPFYRIVLELDPQQILLKQIITGGMITLFATAQAWVISAYDAVIVACYTRRLRG